MKHEMTQWKGFVSGHTFPLWPYGEIEHKLALVRIIIAMDTQLPEKLVM